MLTKAQVRTSVQELIDDEDAAKWDATALDLLIDGVFDWGWGEILQHDPYRTSYVDTVATLTSPGYIKWAKTATGDLTYRPYRVQLITRSGRHYAQITPDRLVLESSAVTVRDAPKYSWAFYGDQIHLFPYDTTTDVEVRYSYRPDAYSSVADGSAVVWPEGHVQAPIWEAAARATMRGDREDATQLQRQADRHWAQLFAEIDRRSVGPAMPLLGTSDGPWDFGGE